MVEDLIKKSQIKITNEVFVFYINHDNKKALLTQGFSII
jgi:hypothetical protein